MNAASPQRAATFDELAPLIEHCKAGRLFAVQDWIAEGKPVLLPQDKSRRSRKRSPLEWAVDLGFHSLLEVLLKAGAGVDAIDDNSLVFKVLQMRRLDMLELLVEHGFDLNSVPMTSVFESWEPDIMEFFIDRGADVETGEPLAWALCNRIRTSLRILKNYRDQFSSFQEQANVALRHHCKEGNKKWVSLMIWAGADPLALGDEEPDARKYEGEEGASAIEFAALNGHFDVLSMKSIKLDLDHQSTKEILKYCHQEDGFDFAKRLLSDGLDPNDQENGGCSAIQHALNGIDFSGKLAAWFHRGREDNYDTEEARRHLALIHLLVQHGGRWAPTGRDEINEARRSLLKMDPQYTVEFVWIMGKYHACAKCDIDALMRTPTIKRHVREYQKRISHILDEWEEDEVLVEATRETSVRRGE